MANTIILRKGDTPDYPGVISINNKIILYKNFKPFELPDNFLTREEELDLKDYLTHLKIEYEKD